MKQLLVNRVVVVLETAFKILKSLRWLHVGEDVHVCQVHYV
jgi:hypothetical protein